MIAPATNPKDADLAPSKWRAMTFIAHDNGFGGAVMTHKFFVDDTMPKPGDVFGLQCVEVLEDGTVEFNFVKLTP